MTRHVLLDNVTHKDLRVITRHAPEFGDSVGSVLTFPTEYADVQREYPIFFRKDPATSVFQSIALLGFRKDENLFLTDDGWNASYLPGIVARGPFLIGFQQQEVDGTVRREPVIHVDMDNPRVSATEGEAIFLPHGGNSRYLERIATILSGIRDGLAASQAMFDAFTAFDLIEPVNVEIRFNSEVQFNLRSLYTINKARLAALDGASLASLNGSGFLEGAFLVSASMRNVERLIDMKRRREPAV